MKRRWWVTIFCLLLLSYIAYSLGLFSSWTSSREIVIYSHRQKSLLRPLIEDFEKKTNIRVKVLFAKRGLEERIKIEGKGTSADVLLTTGVMSLARAQSYGITQPVNDEQIINAVPRNFQEKHTHWLGLSMRARIAFVHKDEQIESLTYWDMMHNSFKDNFCMRDPQHPYNIALFAAMIAHRGKAETRTWLQGLRDNLARTPSGGDRAQIRAVEAGQCKMALANTYYYGVLAENDPDSVKHVKTIFPTFVNGGTHINISGMALMRYAPNKEDALLFMRFLVSPHAQSLYAKINHEWPVVKGVSPGPYIAKWGASLFVDPLPLTKIIENVPVASVLVGDVFNQ